MKIHSIFVVPALVVLAMIAPARAELTISMLYVDAYASASHEQTVREFHSNGLDVNNTPDIRSDDIPGPPFAHPLVVTAAAASSDVVATAYQTKAGFFQSSASIHGGSVSATSNAVVADALAATSYIVVVETSTPDTPLVLDFDFLGAIARASAYFGFGTIDAIFRQTIKAERRSSVGGLLISNPLSTYWGFEHSITFEHSQWAHVASHLIDTEGIGLPVATVTALEGRDPQNPSYVRSTGLEVSLAAFHGTLDFGLLQPGEFFALQYFAETYVRSEFAYDLGDDAFVSSMLVDPFILGGNPAPMLSLHGLVLPDVPEPSAGVLSMTGLAACLRRRIRRHCPAPTP